MIFFMIIAWVLRFGRLLILLITWWLMKILLRISLLMPISCAITSLIVLTRGIILTILSSKILLLRVPLNTLLCVPVIQVLRMSVILVLGMIVPEKFLNNFGRQLPVIIAKARTILPLFTVWSSLMWISRPYFLIVFWILLKLKWWYYFVYFLWMI